MKTLTWTKLHVSRRRSLQQAVQNAGPVEPGRHREPAGDGGGLEPADLLQLLIQIIFVKATPADRMVQRRSQSVPRKFAEPR